MKRKESCGESLSSNNTLCPPSTVADCSKVDTAPLPSNMGKKKGKTGKHAGKSNSDDRTSEFPVHPLRRFAAGAVNFRQPVEFGNFSLDINRSYCDDDRQLRDYHPPQSEHFNFDLAVGYDVFKKRDENVEEKLDTLLQWLQKHGHQFSPADLQGSSAEKSFNTDFISWRGLFTKILCTPYERREPWQFAVVKLCGTIFFCEVETAYKKTERLNRPARLEKMCYWGFKFEDYVTKGGAGEKDQGDGINNSESFTSVVRTRLNEHSIVVGAEVDCRDGNLKEKAPNNYIELKTTRHMNNRKHWENFVRYKLIKYWAQSFLGGIPKIICGLRDDSGVVDELQTFKTLEIPKMSAQLPGSWDANVCLNFANRFLTFVKKTVVEEGAEFVYMFYFNEPFETVTVKKRFGEGQRFLPDWFVSCPLKT